MTEERLQAIEKHLRESTVSKYGDVLGHYEELCAEVRHLQGILSTYESTGKDRRAELHQLREALRASSACVQINQRMAAAEAEKCAACEERCNRLLRLLGAEMAKAAGIDG